jgi:hypothetical protein
MGEPEGDEKAEQEAREVGNKQETEQGLTLNRKEVLAKLFAPSNTLGLLSLYVVFVGTVVAFGVLAFYTGHKTTQEIVFFVSAILFLALPSGALWYLFPLFIKKATLSKLLDKINQSSIAASLARLNNNRIFRLFNLALYAFNIADAIYLFPKHPRLSLALLTVYVALLFWLLSTWALEVLKRRIYETLAKFLEFTEETFRIAGDAYRMAKSSHDFIQNTEESHSEAHKTSSLAIRAVNDAVQELARFVKKTSQVESEEKGPTDPN